MYIEEPNDIDLDYDGFCEQDSPLDRSEAQKKNIERIMERNKIILS